MSEAPSRGAHAAGIRAAIGEGRMKTLAMALLKKPYRKSTKKNMPKTWFDDLPHTHNALDDAIEQGALFCNMVAQLGLTGNTS